MAFAWANSKIQCDGRADDGDDSNGAAQIYRSPGLRCADNKTIASSAAGNNETVLAGNAHAEAGDGAHRVAIATSSNKAVSTFTIHRPSIVQKIVQFLKTFQWNPKTIFKTQYTVEVGISAKMTSGIGRLSFNASMTDMMGFVTRSTYIGGYDLAPSTATPGSIDIKRQGVLIATISNPGTYVDRPTTPIFDLEYGDYTFNFEMVVSARADGLMAVEASVVVDPGFV